MCLYAGGHQPSSVAWATDVYVRYKMPPVHEFFSRSLTLYIYIFIWVVSRKSTSFSVTCPSLFIWSNLLSRLPSFEKRNRLRIRLYSNNQSSFSLPLFKYPKLETYSRFQRFFFHHLIIKLAYRQSVIIKSHVWSNNSKHQAPHRPYFVRIIYIFFASFPIYSHAASSFHLVRFNFIHFICQ